MGIQKQFLQCLMVYSFFLFMSHGLIAHSEQDDLIGSHASIVEKTVAECENDWHISVGYSRLPQYGAAVLTSVLLGLLDGYICGHLDNRIGPWCIFCTWPLFASLRFFTLAHAEREIFGSLDTQEKGVSYLNWMITIARVAEWAAWLKVIGEM